ncbi:protein of unknown function [Burkholderia multivorans]
MRKEAYRTPFLASADSVKAGPHYCGKTLRQVDAANRRSVISGRHP